MNTEPKKITHYAAFTAIAVILNLLELLLPQPLPWIRYGFAQIVTLILLYKFGLKPAVSVLIMRVLIVGVVKGGLLNPLVLITLVSGLGAVLIMHLLKTGGKRLFSVIGVSVGGSVCFNTVQMILAWQFIIRQESFLQMVPLTAAVSVFTGMITGIIALYIIERIDAEPV